MLGINVNVTVEYVTDAELQTTIDSISAKYPWFVDYPVHWDIICARKEIEAEYGIEVGNEWARYDVALWMLTGRNAGERT